MTHDSRVLFQVMTVTSDAETEGFLAPSFTFMPIEGWKRNMTLDCFSHPGDLIEDCIEAYAVNQSEFIQDVFLGSQIGQRRWPLRRGISFVEGLADPGSSRAKYFTISMGDRITPDWNKDQIFFEFLYNVDFELYIHDPKFFAMTWMPLATPALQESISVNKTVNHYYPIIMTEVKELDPAQDPCNDGEEYNLQDDNMIVMLFVRPICCFTSLQNCVSESITRLLGCKPKWERSTGENSILKCNNASQFRCTCFLN